ncbi:L,D-transpeptidase family protein [Flavobacterium soyangense]|uniref:L,D-transpeptidase family protein n=1 Tax=Flavobacterium soyangense TaxID=2023265 RepID=A0A930U9S1_9FLAO|nr:L,D-transpeptidase family protein [Flavobacterium soyangense]MBF2707484.1 L,D-transpeptidase family protein [Flavobacterium soyangense]
MKKFILSIVVLFLGFFLVSAQHNKNENQTAKKTSLTKVLLKLNGDKATTHINDAIISGFFKKYPDLKIYQSDVTILYKTRKYKPIWHENKDLIEFAHLLYLKVNQLEEEGVESDLANKDEINEIFNSEFPKSLSQTDTELMLSSMYLFYAKKVYYGIDTKKIQEIGWFIPRKNLSYGNLLNSLLANPELLNKNENQLFRQYYKLRDVLKKYRQIEKNGDWKFITSDSLEREFRPKDSSKTIGQIRHRLAVAGDLKQDSKSNIYDEELMAGVLNYKKRNGFKPDYIIASKHIQNMNVPVEQYIKTIKLNMERCRWIDPELTKANEYIIINIPSYKLLFKRNGKTELESKLFVGKNMTETVVFSSNMAQIIFSPYWYVPKSIIDYELKYEIEREKNYLATHNMEWNNGKVRQKPGVNNTLGLVKFVFPNSNDIYLHDTPSKNLFKYEYRAFSHGCINIDKAKELAEAILKNDPDWPIERINEAMNGKKETICNLKKKIPIHIGYFTAWVNDSGEINFFTDIYSRDDCLAELLFSDDFK